MASNSELETIHVQLVDEPVPVWRPVSAMKIGELSYQIVPQLIPPDEEWEFPAGARVKVEWRDSDDGKYLTAVSKLDHRNV